MKLKKIIVGILLSVFLWDTSFFLFDVHALTQKENEIVYIHSPEVQEIIINEKQALNTIINYMPRQLDAVTADNKIVQLPVTWECVGDYEKTTYFYYQFIPNINAFEYSLSENIEVPYMWVKILPNIKSTRAVTNLSVETIVYNFLINDLGCNLAAAVGILANIERESTFDPQNTVLDTNNKISYGLCQWNDSRFENLKDYCNTHGYLYSTVEGQLSFLKYELNTTESKAWRIMQEIENTSEGAYLAGYKWAEIYERCDKIYYEVSATRARDVYWPNYGGKVNLAPIGYYDTAEGGDACIHVTGWAYDPDTLDQSVTIHVYVDGTRIQNEYKANIERNDVNTAYGCGAYHGFDIEIPYSVAATGEHTVEVYALNTTYGESAKHLGAKTVTIKADTLAPTITDVEILDLTKNGFTIQCNVSDNAEVSEVKIAVWPHPDGSWNHVWHTATVSDGVATCYIDVNETHGGIVDYKYAAHIYAYDAAGNETKVGTPWIYVDATPPVISNVIVEEDSEGYTITCDVSDNGEVDYVQFPTWTTLNGQDDLVGNDGSWAYLECYRGTYSDGKATFRVNKSEHNNETGQYQTDIYSHDKCNNESKYTLKYTIEDKVEEPPHSHSYVSKVTKEATCTEKGVKTYTCECKDSYTEEIPVKGHSYEEGSCIRCGAKDPDYVPETEVDSTSPQIIVESVTASAGKTVDVKISLKNNPGIASMKLKVAYDSRLTLESVTYNNQLGGQSQQPQNMSSPVTLNWFNGAANSIGDIEYAILKFKLSDTAESGTKASISVNYNPDDIYNIAEDNISFAVVNGAINVIEHIPGDINGDKLVNNKDLSRLFQYLSEWDVEVVEEVLDVNGDGNTNNKDLTRLFQYLSEWDVEIY